MTILTGREPKRVLFPVAVVIFLSLSLFGWQVVAAPKAEAQAEKMLEIFKKARALEKAGKYREALPYAERALLLGAKIVGTKSETFAILAGTLADLYGKQGRYGQAERLYLLSIKIRENTKGPDDLFLAKLLNNLGELYRGQGRYGKAEPLYRRSKKIYAKAFGEEDPNVGTGLNNLAMLYEAKGRYGKAEALYLRSLKIRETALGRNHHQVGSSLNNLAGLYKAKGHYEEAEPLYRRSLAIFTKALGRDHPLVAIGLVNLAEFYRIQGRYGEAIPLYQLGLAIFTKALGRDHPNVGTTLNNLALVYQHQRRHRDAEGLYQRSLDIRIKALGRDHHEVGSSLNNLAEVYRSQRRYKEAEPLYLRTIEIYEKAFGRDHSSVATSLNNLAELYKDTERYKEAKLLYQRSLKMRVKVLGRDHISVGISHNNLAFFYFKQSEWRQAVDHWRQATRVLIRRIKRGEKVARGVVGEKKSEVIQKRSFFLGLIKSVYRDDHSTQAGHEMFESAQWAIGSQAAGALAQMSARKAAGSSELSKMVRERQDKVAAWQSGEKRMSTILAAGKRNAKLEAQMEGFDKRIRQIDTRLAKSFPDYAALASPKPLAVSEVQKLLKPHEALVLLLDTPRGKPTPAETFIWAVTKDKAVWKRAELGGKALADKVAKLRCGLDGSNWIDPLSWPDADAADKQAKVAQQARRNKCIKLIGKTYTEKHWPPFEFDTAFELYQKLFGPIRDVIKGKKLLVVSSGALTGLPLHVLVTRKTASAGPTDAKAYQNAAWLINSHAITTLPSVSSLKALRGIAKKGGQAKNPLIGFADPVFSLPSAKPVKLASADPKSIDPKSADPNTGVRKRKRSVLRSYSAFFKGRNADLSTLANSLPQLDGTRRELLEVGRVLNVQAKNLLLGRAATERAVKEAKLDQYRIVYFATHGLISGDVKGLGEPALAFSLPAKASPLDDGLLTASEVTQLKLNADWLVMSACNTAAGDKPGAEALSGLARAFFYAGAKTLLVSHWPVGDEAAVALTTHAFQTMDKHPGLGRAEALRRSMRAMIKKGKLANAHPTSWAPFVVVGEGAGR